LAVFSAPEAGLCLTGVCWAPHAPDLLACAYAKPAGGTVDGYDGAVRLWSHARHATPDATFACQSPVTCVAFDEANPSLVLGGTYSGQVVLWDVRSPSTLPTMRSPPGQQKSEILNFKGSYRGPFPLVLADFWTSDHLSERSRSVDAFSGTRARGTLTLKRR
jgi:WD40 repeat protein